MQRDSRFETQETPPVIDGREKSLTLLIVTNLLLFLTNEFIYVVAIPVFKTMYSDFGAKLPSLTQKLFDWPWYAGPASITAILAAILGLMRGTLLAKRTLKPIAIFQVMLTIACIAILFMPIFEFGATAPNK